PFGDLSQPLSDIGDQPINRLRVPIEVMRRHLSQRPALLAALWTFEPAAVSGSSVADASGNNNAVTIVGGLTLEDGPRGGQAISLDGGTRYAQVNHSPTLELGKDGADFSVAFSIYLRQGPTGAWRLIMHKGSTSTERTFDLWLCPDRNQLQAGISTTA